MLYPGDIVSAKYEVDSVCSDTGGMGVLLYVKDIMGRRGERLVLKYCKEEGDEFIKRFRREVRFLNEFKGNSKVAQLIDFDVDHEPPYYVMKYYPQGDLAKIETLRDNLELQEDIFCQMIDCIQELHSRNKFHRDIKPQNFLYDNGVVLVSDFGLSFELESKTGFTSTTESWGTQGYLPPEYHSGGFKNADAPGDIFMLGKSFYVLLSGRDPLYLVNDGIAEPMFRLIQKCCDLNKARRYQSLADLKQSLVAIYDVVLNRTNGVGKVIQMLESINDCLERDIRFDSNEVIQFIEELEKLDNEDINKICQDVPGRLYHVFREPPVVSYLEQYLQMYRGMVVERNYGWDYAEDIARNMNILFNGENVPVEIKAIALELAVGAAIRENRFAAMDTCVVMIQGIVDDILGLAIRDVLIDNRQSFIKRIEVSECQNDVVRRVLKEIREGNQE